MTPDETRRLRLRLRERVNQSPLWSLRKDIHDRAGAKYGMTTKDVFKAIDDVLFSVDYVSVRKGTGGILADGTTNTPEIDFNEPGWADAMDATFGSKRDAADAVHGYRSASAQWSKGNPQRLGGTSGTNPPPPPPPDRG